MTRCTKWDWLEECSLVPTRSLTSAFAYFKVSIASSRVAISRPLSADQSLACVTEWHSTLHLLLNSSSQI